MGPKPAATPPFRAVFNFRDIASHPTAEGRRTRTGVFFRSASLNNATPAELDALRFLGVRTLANLRHPEEVAQFPMKNF